MRNLSLKITIPFLILTGSVSAFGANSPTNLKSLISEYSNTIKNWGLVNDSDKSHIHAVDAWQIEEGNRNIVVAVIDTGIDASHKSLSPNIWHKEGSSRESSTPV